MTTNKFYFRLFMLLGIVFALSACDKDDDIVLPEGKLIENTELQSVLKTMGFEFDAGKLVMNEKATSTTTLDLSGKELTSCKGLDIFPALKEVNLANNKFEEFDFDMLPAKITKIDLQGNKLYEFKNLKPERKLEKLYLPETAKYNMDEVLAYYTENKGKVDMQIAMNSKLEKYSYLRTVPDDILRADLKERFPSVFTGDKIDLSKEMAVNEAGNGLILAISAFYGDYDKDIKNLDGIQYIIGVENFKGNIAIRIPDNKTVKLNYLKIPKETNMVILHNITLAQEVNWNNSKKLETIGFRNLKGLKKIDLSHSETFLKEGKDGFPGHGIDLQNCSDLEELIMPDRKGVKDVSLSGLKLKNLPKLKEFDFSQLMSFANGGMTFSGIANCKLVFPTGLVKPEGENHYFLEIDKEVNLRTQTKEFINKFKNILDVEVIDNSTTKSALKPALANSGITGNYSGILEPIMNGTTYNNVNSTFTLTETATNKMNIYLPPFKVGKMPGKLHIDIKNTSFTTATNGDISFTGSQPKCVILNFLWGFKYPGDYNGTIKGNTLDFNILSVGKILVWETFRADVTFNGTKN